MSLERWLRGLQFLSMGLSAIWCVIILLTFMMRVTFPLELEWMEGGVLHQALRIQQGLTVYGPPSSDFVPFLYPPLYPAVIALVGSVWPLDYTVARVVSILSVVVIVWGLWHLVGREGKSATHQSLAVALFLSGYVFSYRWLDVGRADSLFLALLLWGLICLRESWGRWSRAILAGVLISLAFWAKQTAFVFIIASGASIFLVAPAQVWIYVSTVALVAGGGVLIGNGLSEGWLWTYIFELHQSHAFNWQRFTHKSWEMFAHAWPFVLILLLVLVIESIWPWVRQTRRLGEGWMSRLFERIRASRGTVYWGIWCIVGLLVSALGYSTQWAESNAFIPGVCFLAAFVAVVLPVGGFRECWALGLVSVQLLFAIFFETNYQIIWDKGYSKVLASYRLQDIWRTIPTRSERQKANSMRQTIENKVLFKPSGSPHEKVPAVSQGELFALHRPWWSILAGGSGHVGTMGLNDIGAEYHRPIVQDIRGKLKSGGYAAVVVEGKLPKWMSGAMVDGYRLDRRIVGKKRVLPLVGYMSRAGMTSPYRGQQMVFVQISGSQARSNVRVIADFEDGTFQGFKTEGTAFGRGPARSLSSKLPPIGPHGGKFLLSSAAGLQGIRGIGRARSSLIHLDDRAEAIEMMIGVSRESSELSAKIVKNRVNDPDSAKFSKAFQEVELRIVAKNWQLERLRWEIPLSWKGGEVFIEIRDDSDEAALFVDEIQLIDSFDSPLGEEQSIDASPHWRK